MKNKNIFGLFLILMVVFVGYVSSKANPNQVAEETKTIKSGTVNSQLATSVLETVITNYFVLNGEAYSQGNCNHLTNPTAKRHCLQQRLDEANRQQRLHQERLNRLNLRMQQACSAVG